MTPPTAILDQYPSTFDYQTKDPIDDPVLLILKNARERYKKGATATTYIGGNLVCAIGAIGAEIGGDSDQWEDFANDLVIDEPTKDHRFAFKRYLENELRISDSAKEAINLLDKSALFLYGDKIPKTQTSYAWALEWVNQRFCWDTGEAKEAVLQCYDHAILERERSVIA